MTQIIPSSSNSKLAIEHSFRLKQLELDSLLEMTQAINSNLTEESLYKIYNFTFRANLNIGRFALYVLNQKWECKVNFGTKDNFLQIPISENLLNITETTRVANIDSSIFKEEFDYIIPVSYQSGVLAYVFVGGMTLNDEQLINSTISFVQTISNIMLVAIENKKLIKYQLEQEALKREIQIAKQVQTLLFPKVLPNHDNLQVNASYLPHLSVGGDYYDFININEHQHLFCIADVSGKGIPAALLMANFQASLRTLIRQTTNLRQITDELNYLIKQNGNGENFITFFVGIYDSKKRIIDYVNAGHNPPILIFRNGSIISLEVGTTVLGIFDPLPFLQEGIVEVTDDFLLFAYTDGLTEIVNETGEEFGPERVQAFLSGNAGLPLNQLHDNLIDHLKDFKGMRSSTDDITMLSVRVVR